MKSGITILLEISLSSKKGATVVQVEAQIIEGAAALLKTEDKARKKS